MSIPQDHVRYIIFYEWRRGTGAMAAVRNINSVYEKDTTPTATVHRWFARFKKGDTDFINKPRSERPLVVDDSVILDTVKKDLEVNTLGLATRLGCVQPTTVGCLHVLGYRKLLTR